MTVIFKRVIILHLRCASNEIFIKNIYQVVEFFRVSEVSECTRSRPPYAMLGVNNPW